MTIEQDRLVGQAFSDFLLRTGRLPERILVSPFDTHVFDSMGGLPRDLHGAHVIVSTKIPVGRMILVDGEGGGKDYPLDPGHGPAVALVSVDISEVAESDVVNGIADAIMGDGDEC